MISRLARLPATTPRFGTLIVASLGDVEKPDGVAITIQANGHGNIILPGFPLRKDIDLYSEDARLLCNTEDFRRLKKKRNSQQAKMYYEEIE